MVLCDGDLRQGITLLQSAFRLAIPCDKKESTKSVPITRDDLDRVATVVPDSFENALISAAKKRDFDAVQSTILVRGVLNPHFSVRLDSCAHWLVLLQEFTRESLSAPQFLTQLQSKIMESTEFSDRSKQTILKVMAVGSVFVSVFAYQRLAVHSCRVCSFQEIDLRIIQGAEEYIQLLHLGCQMIKSLA